MSQSLDPFRVAFDLRATESGFKAHYGRGTGRYAAELYKHLSRITGTPDTRIRLSAIQSEQLRPRAWERMLIDAAPLGKGTLSTQLVLPRALRRLKTDLVHFCAHGDAPSRPVLPYLVTVLDLIPLKLADMYRADNPNWRYRLARTLELRALRGAVGILAISENTKRDIVEILSVDPERILVTPLGVDSSFSPRPLDLAGIHFAKTQARRALGLPQERKLLLYVGGIDPRKNIAFMLEVFDELRRSWSGDPAEKPMLVMAGRYDRDKHFPELQEKLRNLRLEEDVRLMGFVPDENLTRLYHSADLVLFPSLYEGFGLPALEAMACGVPVIVGDNSCMGEVVGAEGIRLPDGDRDVWVREIRGLLGSTERHLELAHFGVKRAAQFTWARTAELTLEAYENFIPREMMTPRGIQAARANGRLQ